MHSIEVVFIQISSFPRLATAVTSYLMYLRRYILSRLETWVNFEISGRMVHVLGFLFHIFRLYSCHNLLDIVLHHDEQSSISRSVKNVFCVYENIPISVMPRKGQIRHGHHWEETQETHGETQRISILLTFIAFEECVGGKPRER